jgi:asparagine synthase (glutamine-hydrolysing)
MVVQRYGNKQVGRLIMCGICGFLGFEDREVLKRMVKILAHRGPDDSGLYVDENVSLGHARLSIIDLSERGRQPMSNENGPIWIVYNGETYNFKDLRRNLEKKHNFYSDTDTEVLIHAYEEYGIDFIKKLRGMFAFALYDSEKKKLILARDPIGKKPLYYYWDGERFIFASEIKAILETGIEREIDTDGLCAYLTHQYTIGRNTMFKGIKKLLGGELLIFDIKKEDVEIKRYWDIKEDIINQSEGYCIKKLKSLLEESAKLRTIADVPVGAFLSGGIDSTSVVALSKPNVDYDFHTFSMGFGELFSELDYATVHHEIIIEPTEVIKELERIAWHYDEPLGDAAIIANYFLAKEAKKYVTVVVAGESGDELFGGYGHYKIGLKAYPYFMLPKIFKNGVKHVIFLSLPKEGLFKRRWQYFLNYFAQKNFNIASLYLLKSAMTDEELKWFSSGGLKFDEDLIVFSNNNIKHPLNKMLALDCKNLLPEKFLMKADKAIMANSVEERLPIMDKNIVEFAFRIPPKFKIKKGNEKYILKMAVKDLVPREIIKRRKTGFGVPYKHWVKREMKELVEQKLSEGGLIKRLFEKEKIEKLIYTHKNSKWSHSTALVWNLFALELWYEQFFEKDKTDGSEKR